MPHFTVLMANYNNGLYIEEAIQSVLQQSFTEWELVIIDDASTDDSLARITVYVSDPRIRLYRKEQNEGYTKALIFGLTKVSTDIVGILDSDDALARSAIERVHAAHVEHPELGLVLSQVVLCDSALNPLYTSVTTPKHIREPLLWMRGPTAFRSFKMAAYRKTAGLDPGMLSGEDADLLFKLEEVAPTRRLDEPLYIYRQLGSSQSKSARSYRVTYCCIARAVNSAYLRRRGTSVPNVPRHVPLAWLIAGMRYSLELNAPAQAIDFILRAFSIAPFEPAAYRALMRFLRAFMGRSMPREPGGAVQNPVTTMRFYPVREFQSDTGNREPDRIVCIPLVHKPGHCLFGGDYLIFETALYRATFETLVVPYGFAQDPVVVLDVYENLLTKVVLAVRQIALAELAARPRSFSVDFAAKEGERVEFRVYWAEQCHLSVTGVTLAKLDGVLSKEHGCEATLPQFS